MLRGARTYTVTSQRLVSYNSTVSYLIVDDQVLSWVGARDYCRSQGGELTSVSSQNEQDFIKSNLRSTVYFIGLANLGAQTANRAAFTWSDGTPVSYSNWYPGEPTGVGFALEGQCVCMTWWMGFQW